MASTPVFIATPRTPAISIVNADGTVFKTVFTAGSLGSRIDTLIATNSDAANASVVQLALQKSGVDYVLGEIAVPIGSGTNGSAKSVALLNSTDIPGLGYTESGSIFLEQGVSLRARVKTAVSGSNSVQIVGVGGDV